MLSGIIFAYLSCGSPRDYCSWPDVVKNHAIRADGRAVSDMNVSEDDRPGAERDACAETRIAMIAAVGLALSEGDVLQ